MVLCSEHNFVCCVRFQSSEIGIMLQFTKMVFSWHDTEDTHYMFWSIAKRHMEVFEGQKFDGKMDFFFLYVYSVIMPVSRLHGLNY